MNLHTLSPIKIRTGQDGFSLVELMVAITIGLAIAGGMTAMFVNNSQSRSEIERANRQIENGRYATQVLTEDLRLAGFLGEFDPTVLTSPATKPDPCLTSLADLKSAMPLHVQGYDNGASLSCLSDVRTGTDILVVRRVSTCTVGETNCDPASTGTPYFQASLCDNTTELGSVTTSDHYALDTASANLTRHKRDCTTLASQRRYRTHIYFIANNDNSGDGIPTLKRAELGASGGGSAFTIVPLVEGIENMQIEYGIDSDSDGIPNSYTADPDNGCVAAACVTNWRNVVSVKLNLLARNTEKSSGYTDTKTYSLGLTANGSSNTAGPFNDNYKRHAYESLVRLNNPAGRKEP